MKTRLKRTAPRARRPIMAVLDVLGQRWSLRILWELRERPLAFRALQVACSNLSPTTLNTRLDALRALGAVEHVEGRGYALTDAGLELGKTLLSLNSWAERHANPATASSG